MREELIANGLKFLQHPNVQSTPLNERITFLEKKGMTKEEIDKAVDQYKQVSQTNETINSNTNSSSVSPVYNTIQPNSSLSSSTAGLGLGAVTLMKQKQSLPSYLRVLRTVASVIGIAAVLGFVWQLALQNGYIPWLKSPQYPLLTSTTEEKEKEEKEDEAFNKNLEELSQSIKLQTQEMSLLSKRLQEHSNTSNQSQEIEQKNHAMAIAELKAEVSTLKMLLLTSEKKPQTISLKDEIEMPLNTHDLVSNTEKKDMEDMKKRNEAKFNSMLKALNAFQNSNSIDQLVQASGILSMYMKNLIENPDIPRYRRIAIGNSNYKEKIEPLIHSSELLESIGFIKAGMTMEWKWSNIPPNTDEFQEKMMILKSCLRAIQSLSTMSTTVSSISNLALEDIAKQEYDQLHMKQNDVLRSSSSNVQDSKNAMNAYAKRRLSLPEKATKPSNSDTSLDAFMSRLGKRVGTQENQFSTMSSAVSPVQEDLDEEKHAPPSAASNENAQTVDRAIEQTNSPSYPKSFGEVMKLVQNGEPVPGIREIENRLSIDSDTLLNQSQTNAMKDHANEEQEELIGHSPLRKPWEKQVSVP